MQTLFRTVHALSVIVALLATGATAVAGSIDLLETTTFHRATYRSDFNESWDVDDGGVLFLFVRNLATASDSVSEVRINGTSVTSLPEFKWWRAWPPTMAGSGQGNIVSAVTIKTTVLPLAEGQTVSIEVISASGASAVQTYTCTTPALRIGYVVASQDRRVVNIFLRNDDSVPLTVDQVRLNDWSLIPGLSTELTLVGGTTIPANGIGVAKVTFPSPLPSLANLAVAAHALRSGGGAMWVAAPIRLGEPIWFLGSWGANIPSSETGQQYFRKLHGNINTGTTDISPIDEMYRAYGIQSAPHKRASGQDYPDIPYIQQNADKSSIGAWYVRDEPDISGKSSVLMYSYNQDHWNNDSRHPTILNLTTTRAFNEYGHIADIPAMDHYCYFNAPSNIPGTWFSRTSGMDEAFLWMLELKSNTEPKPCMAWSQVASGAWSHQPDRWGINVQFWSQVAAGAKAIFWFIYDANRENDPTYSDQIGEALQIGRELNQVRGLLTYGDPLGNVNRSTTSIRVRQIVGENATLVVVTNFNYSIGGLPWSPSYTVNSQNAWVEVPVPAWIPVQRVAQVTENGLVSPSWTINGQTVRIDFSIYRDALIYVIGRNDTQGPAAPTGLTFADPPDGSSVVLGWRESFDDVGVRGYKVYRNGTEVAETLEPYWAGQGSDEDEWMVRAFDSSGNLGAASLPATRLHILSHPKSAFACLGDPAEFTVSAVGSGTLHYSWRVAGTPVGVDSSTLVIPSVTSSENNAQVRCLVSDDYRTEWTNVAVLRTGVCVRPDFDRDGDVDVADLSTFLQCITGPQTGSLSQGCVPTDLDGDNDVDQADFGTLQRCLSGSANSPYPSCAD